MEGVLRNPLHYSLRDTGIVDLYQLSADNYGDSLFIHPPVFVYCMAALNHVFGLPLPAVSVVYHLLTLLLLVPLSGALLASVGAVTGGKGGGNRVVGLWAAVVYSMCPIAAFCSQKVWIDNSATFAVTVCATVHVHLISRQQRILFTCFHVNSLTAHFLSGLLFGILAMNTKITCLALLPFLLFWSWYCVLFPIEAGVSDSSHCVWTSAVRRALSRSAWLVCGIVVGHVPWMCIYYVSTVLF